MTHISGNSRSQLLLLPERVDDYVGPDNTVRFIDAFVDGLDLKEVGFTRVQSKSTGRPGYDPADLLKLYIYGYLNRIRSSRKLEVETHRNIEVIWLLRHLKPDFKTIADFRRDNRSCFKKVFREFVLLCRQLDLFGRKLLAVDGTKIKAVNSKANNFTRVSLSKMIKEADERLDTYLKRLDEGDKGDVEVIHSATDQNLAEKINHIKTRQNQHKALLEQLEETGESQISLSDPDSRRMMGGSTGHRVSYNAQIAVDCKHNLIVEQEVCNQGFDLGLLAKTAGPARSILGVEEIEVVADKGYYKIEDIEACEKDNLIAYVSKPQRGSSVAAGYFSKEVFRFDERGDFYICPAGKQLSTRYISKLRDNTRYTYCNRAACRVCPLRSRCTNKGFRKVSRFENEVVLTRMAERLKKRPEMMNLRRCSVEHPFGSIKQWMNQGAFLTCRLENVRGEFSLTALAYNMRRAINLVGVKGLMAALET
ncbi:IS1182 family transposase [Kiloniella antarctica]|uniref:IS1182 family transposase n=1 Tax=Kiloniella antarctica TaxID=1550907 RepID=A0ABW5BS78_9PROT